MSKRTKQTDSAPAAHNSMEEPESGNVPNTWDAMVEELKEREAALRKMARELARQSPTKKPKLTDDETP